MAETGLSIKISADVRDAAVALGGLNDNFVELVTEAKGSVASISLALSDLKKAAEDAGDPKSLGLFNRAIKDLSVEAKNLSNVGVAGFDEFGVKIKETAQTYTEILDQFKSSPATIGTAVTALQGLKKSLITETDIGAIRNINTEIESLESQIKKLSSAGRAGFDDLGNKVRESAKSLDQILAEFKSSPQSIGAAKAALVDLKIALASATDLNTVNTLNKNIETVEKSIVDLSRAGKTGFDEFGDAAKKGLGGSGVIGAASGAYGAIRKLAFILPGIGIAGIFALIGDGVLDAVKGLNLFDDKLISTSDLTKKADAEAKKLHDTLVNLKSGTEVDESATGSSQGDIARVRALAAAVQDTTRSYKERQNALTELKETNKAYFGDLTLEAKSLEGLSAKVQEYSNALIQEAIVKANVEEIAKLSSEYLKQKRLLDDLIASRDRAQTAFDKRPVNKDNSANSFLGAGTAQEQFSEGEIKKTTAAFEKQMQVVALLKDQIDTYTGDLSDAIGSQIKLDPLKNLKAGKDTAKEIIPILEQIKKIYDDLRKPDERPLFKRLFESTDASAINVLEAKIAEAIKQGAKAGGQSSELGRAFDSLGNALGKQLDRLKNPDLKARVQGIIDVTAEPIEKVQSKVDKLFGKDIHLKMTPDIEAQINSSGFSSTNRDKLKKVIEDQLKNNIPAVNIQAQAKILIRQDQVKEASQKLLDDVENAVNNAEKNGLEGIGESIGKAIASGKNPIEAAGSAILSSIGDLIESIGKALVEYGIVKEGLDAVISGGFALPGIAAIAVGIGAIAIGELVKTAFKPRHMAEGGILTGPQYVLAGEAGPEAFMPLNKVGSFLNNVQPASEGVNIDHTIRISGSDLAIILKRANKNNSLVS